MNLIVNSTISNLKVHILKCSMTVLWGFFSIDHGPICTRVKTMIYMSILIKMHQTLEMADVEEKEILKTEKYAIQKTIKMT